MEDTMEKEERNRQRKSYTASFKRCVVLEVIEDKQGVRETARKNSINHCMVQRWIKIFLDKGDSGLTDSRALRRLEGDEPAPAKPRSRKPNSKGYIESELPESARNELRYLRMENAYLKKVSALARERER
jgi:transposase